MSTPPLLSVQATPVVLLGHERSASNVLHGYLVLDIYEAPLPEKTPPPLHLSHSNAHINTNTDTNTNTNAHSNIHVNTNIDTNTNTNTNTTPHDNLDTTSIHSTSSFSSNDDNDSQPPPIKPSKPSKPSKAPQPSLKSNSLQSPNSTPVLSIENRSSSTDKTTSIEDDDNDNSLVLPSLAGSSTSGFTPSISSPKLPRPNLGIGSDFDRYGFKKGDLETYNRWNGQYSQYELQNLAKWKRLLQTNGLLTTGVPKRFPPKSDKVKKLIRKGIPYDWRGNAWFFYAGGHEKLNRHVGVYEQILKDTEGVQNKDTEVIERDLNRTFPDNLYFNYNLQQKEKEKENLKGKDDKSTKKSSTIQSPYDPNDPNDPNDLNRDFNGVSNGKKDSWSLVEPPMIQKLRRVLVAFAHFNPQIGYCQLLNFLAGLLILFMPEEHAFWMLIVLTERIIPKVHLQTLEGVHIDQGVLMLCVKEYIPELWAIVGRNFEGETITADKILTRLPPVTLVTLSWFMSVFIGSLPIESVLRIWDILWYEGSKTLFRISLTISRMCMEHETSNNNKHPNGSGGEADQIEYIQFMQNFPRSITDPNHLIDRCFKKIGGYGFGSLSQDEINQCREFVLKQRAKLSKKQGTITTELSEQERRFLEDDTAGHDVYGFHRSLMNGMVWNRNISNRMKRLARKKK